MGKLLKQAFLDGEKGSFGRIFSLPFLFSAWGIGTAYGIIQVINGDAVTDIMLLLFSFAGSLYGGSKGLSILKTKAEKEGKNEGDKEAIGNGTSSSD